MKVRVWLKGQGKDKKVYEKTIEIKGLLTEPIYPMNVRDYLCRMGHFLWKDHTRIRYEKVD